MKYPIREIIRDGESIDFVFDFTPPNGTLTCFLVSDFSNFSDIYLSAIDKVLNGESEKEERTGNDSCVEFGPETTTLEDLFPPDENESAICVVNTKELRQVMDEWLARRKEFREKQNEQKEGKK